MAAHAILAASAAPQWGYCSGSVAANAAVPDFDTEASRIGTAGHWCGETVLRSFVATGEPEGPLLCSDLIGETAPNGVVIDDQMAEGAQVWVDDVLRVAQEYGAVQSLLVEHRVFMPQIHADNWGTLDTGLYLPDHNRLYLWDYKSGHRPHTPKGHLQMIDYTFGLAREFNVPESTEVVLRIPQPFTYSPGGPVKEWRGTLRALYDGFFERLRRQAQEALTSPRMSAGEWCRDCKAVGRCATARDAGYSVIAYADQPYSIDSMDGRSLAVEREVLRVGQVILKARHKAIEDELTYRVKDGATDTGLALQTSQGNLAWDVPAEQAIALAGQFGADIASPGVKTPTQATALVPAKMRPAFEQVLKSVSSRPTTGLKLINAADSRAALAFKKGN